MQEKKSIMIKGKFQSFGDDKSSQNLELLTTEVNQVYIDYTRGRLQLSVNENELLDTNNANDSFTISFSTEITKVEVSEKEELQKIEDYLQAEVNYKKSKLAFSFTPELMLAIYINTFSYGKLNGNALRFYYYHLLNIKNWLEEANYCIGESNKKKKFVELAKENFSKTNGKKLENFYYSLENYTKAKNEVLAFDWIIDSLEKIINNIEFTADFVLGVEILVKDIQLNRKK